MAKHFNSSRFLWIRNETGCSVATGIYFTMTRALCFSANYQCTFSTVLMTFSATVWTFSHDCDGVTLANEGREINSTVTQECNKNEKIIRVQKILPGLGVVKEASHQKWHWNFLFSLSPLPLLASSKSGFWAAMVFPKPFVRALLSVKQRENE